jgi:ABC-2 type transport system permease protein
LFEVEIPVRFERTGRGDKPALPVAADATDPTMASTALGTTALVRDRMTGDLTRSLGRYDSIAATTGPGLVGTILTRTLPIFKAFTRKNIIDICTGSIARSTTPGFR